FPKDYSPRHHPPPRPPLSSRIYLGPHIRSAPATHFPERASRARYLEATISASSQREAAVTTEISHLQQLGRRSVAPLLSTKCACSSRAVRSISHQIPRVHFWKSPGL